LRVVRGRWLALHQPHTVSCLFPGSWLAADVQQRQKIRRPSQGPCASSRPELFNNRQRLRITCGFLLARSLSLSHQSGAADPLPWRRGGPRLSKGACSGPVQGPPLNVERSSLAGHPRDAPHHTRWTSPKMRVQACSPHHTLQPLKIKLQTRPLTFQHYSPYNSQISLPDLDIARKYL
jgi:hypothetical protein